MTLSVREVERWLRPWPIRLKDRRKRWVLRVAPLRACARLFAFWHVGPPREKGAPLRLRTVGWFAREAARGRCPHEQHYIHMLALTRMPVIPSLTVMVVWRKVERRWTVVDGNHHLIAALLAVRRWRRTRTGLTHVGVLVRREPGVKTWGRGR